MALAFAAPELRNDREAFLFHGNFRDQMATFWWKKMENVGNPIMKNPFGDVCNPTGL
jgi:hypothetical protein